MDTEDVSGGQVLAEGAPPQSIRFNLRDHVFEFIHVEACSYAAKLDGVQKRILFREESEEEGKDKTVVETTRDMADLGMLLSLMRAEHHLARNAMWVEVNSVGDVRESSGPQSTDQFVIWVADDGAIAITTRHKSWTSHYSYYS
jgi:hypothetical protein